MNKGGIKIKDIYIKTYLESSYNPFTDAIQDDYILSTKKVVETTF